MRLYAEACGPLSPHQKYSSHTFNIRIHLEREYRLIASRSPHPTSLLHWTRGAWIP